MTTYPAMDRAIGSYENWVLADFLVDADDVAAAAAVTAAAAADVAAAVAVAGGNCLS